MHTLVVVTPLPLPSHLYDPYANETGVYRDRVPKCTIDSGRYWYCYRIKLVLAGGSVLQQVFVFSVVLAGNSVADISRYSPGE